MPQLVFSTEGAAKVVADQDKVTAAQKRTTNALGETRQVANQLDRLANQIAIRQETAQQRYNRLVAETKRLVDTNRLSVELYQQEVADLNREMQRGEGRFKKFGEHQEKAFGPTALGQVKSFAAGFLSVASAIQLARTELQAQQDDIDRITASKLTTSQGRNVLLRNLIGESPGVQQAALKAAQDIAKARQIPEGVISGALAQAVSAGSGDVKAATEAVDVAAQFLPDQLSALGEFAGTLLDLAKVTGTTDAKINLGLLAQVGKAGRIVDPSLQAKNIPPALIGAQSAGLSPGLSASLFAALTSGGADVTGAATGSSFIKLAQALGGGFAPGSEESSAAQKAIETATSRLAASQERLANANDNKRELIESLADEQIDADRRLFDATSRIAEVQEDIANATRTKQRIAAQERLADAQLHLARVQEDEQRRQTSNAKRLADADSQLVDVQKEIATSQKAIAEASKKRQTALALSAAFQGLTPDERFFELQNNPQLAKQFIDAVSFEEAKTRAPIIAAITSPDSPTGKALQDNLKAFGQLTNKELANLGQEGLKAFEQNTFEIIAKTDRAFKSIDEQLANITTTTALTSEQKDVLRNTLRQSGLSSVDARIFAFTNALGGDRGTSLSEAVDILKIRRRALEREVFAGGVARGGPEFQALDAALKVLADIQRQQLREQQRTNEKLDNAGGIVGAPG